MTKPQTISAMKVLSPGRENHLPDRLVERDEVTEQQLKAIVRQMGLKITNQRLAILKALTVGRAHVTAQEVFERVSGDFPEIGFATVYRFLRKMSELHYVTEVRMGGLPARYELTPRRHHDHLTCVRCGRIVEFENQKIETLQTEVARNQGFLLTHHVLELYGFCRSCQST
jgi:Fur family transcriptional regulator, ferric uptake regulator